jgi:hypothetical protein
MIVSMLAYLISRLRDGGAKAWRIHADLQGFRRCDLTDPEWEIQPGRELVIY